MHIRTVAAFAFFVLASAILSSSGTQTLAQGPRGQGPRGVRGAPNTAPDAPRGLRLKTDAVTPGYLLFAPLSSDVTLLIDNDGNAVRAWKSDFIPSGWIYMLPNGNILRGGNEPMTSGFSGGGQGGRFQEFTLDGKLVWDFSLNNEKYLPHHDVAVLPNGNVLAIVWELKAADEARKAGRRPQAIPARGLWPDMLIELQPQRPNGAKIIWEWRAWDHMIQNVDSTLDHYAKPGDHPERIDINGDLVGTTGPQQNPPADFQHTNSVDYNPALDQIILSVPRYNEIWVIDHSTSTSQAAGSKGGKSGKGGDLLYRWGNPQLYERGTAADQMLGFEHDARWIPEGRPGTGHIMVFSNRTPGATGVYTKVYELAPPVGRDGKYTLPPTGPFGPAEPVWTYSAPDFDANYISGAERLANGNTLISSGPQGRVFELGADNKIVWEYWSPYSGAARTGGGNSATNPFALFRAVRIPANDRALKGIKLEPLNPQPALRTPGP